MIATALTSASGIAWLVQEHTEELVHAGDGGTLAEYAWLIPLLPMVMAFVILFFGRFSPWKGWAMASGTLLFVAVYGTALTVENLNEGIVTQSAINVGDIGVFSIEWGVIVDGLSILKIGRASCREECRSRWSPYH